MKLFAAVLALCTAAAGASGGTENEGGTRGGTKAIVTLSLAEIDEFQEMVRNHHSRPLESIPVSEGGTTFGSVNIAERIEEEQTGSVSCGNHRASNCSLCPQGNGAAWCNGECTWIDDPNQCESPPPPPPPPQKRCDDAGKITHPKCSDCTTAQCTGTLDCELMPSTDLCRYVLDDDSRSASVHLHYITPPTVTKFALAWWFQRLEILSASDATSFSTSAHRFGYAGFQESSESPFQGRIVFSIWDQGGCDRVKNPDCPQGQIAKTIACGTGIKCEGHGKEEGTGRKSIVYSDDLPVTERPYYMVTHAKRVGPFRMQYSAYFYVPGKESWGSSNSEGAPYSNTNPGWRFLSRIEVNTDAHEQWYMSDMSSFVEQWTGAKGLTRRAALFGPSFVAEEQNIGAAASFEQVREAFFTYDKLENHKHVNAFYAPNQPGVGLEIGGDVVKRAREYQTFSFPESDKPPELVELAKASGCLAEATTVVEIEACLSKVDVDDNGPTAVY